MSWWGKAIGGAFGYMLGGPLGALLGAVLGHKFDKGVEQFQLPPNGSPWSEDQWEQGDQERVQAAFFTASFVVMGHIAKADGRVSREEIDTAEELMAHLQLDAEQRQVAIELFNQGRDQSVDIASLVAQLKKECGRRTNLVRFFLEMQITTALADGELHPAEQKILLDVAKWLGVSRFTFERLLATAVAQSRFSKWHGGYHSQSSGTNQSQADNKDTIKEAYQLLGVEETATDAEVKKAYRRMISQNHPDKLVSKGLPDEMMKLATEKTAQIKAAYEQIKKHRQG